MPKRYFFGREKISCNGLKILANDGIEIDPVRKRDVEVSATLVRDPVDAFCKLFNIAPVDMLELCLSPSTKFMQLLTFVVENNKNHNVVVNVLLDTVMKHFHGGIKYYGNHVVLLVREPNHQISLEDIEQEVKELFANGKAQKFDCLDFKAMFNYEILEVQPIGGCLTQIDERRQHSNIPLHFVLSNDIENSNLIISETERTYCYLSQLVVQIFILLKHYYESEDYKIDNINDYHHLSDLLDVLTNDGKKFVANLSKSPIHKMQKQIDDFCIMNMWLEYLIRLAIQQKNSEMFWDHNEHITNYTDVLTRLNNQDVFPSKRQWEFTENDRPIMVGDPRNWIRQMIVSTDAFPMLYRYYEEGELSQFTWILNRHNDKESFVQVDGQKYYLGFTEILPELRHYLETRAVTVFTIMKNNKLAIKHCLGCSKSCTWICRTCGYLLRNDDLTSVICNCGTILWKSLRLYCYDCSVAAKTTYEIFSKPVNTKNSSHRVSHKSNGYMNNDQDHKKSHSPPTSNKIVIPDEDESSKPIDTTNSPIPTPNIHLTTLPAPSSSVEWDANITIYTEHETIPFIVVPRSRSAIAEEWDKNITTYTEHETISFKADLSKVAEEWNRITTVHVEHETIPFKAEPTSLPVPREERDDKIIVNTEDQMNPLTSDNSPTLEEWNKNITIYTEHESIPFQAVPQPPPVVTEEWNKISIVYMEHQKIPLIIIPSPPTVTAEWDNIITEYKEHQKIPLIIIPSPPTVTAEWDKISTVYMEHETIPLLIVPSPPAVTAEWDNNITVYMEHQKIPLLIVPSPPAVTAEWDNMITVYTEHDNIPFIVVPPSPPQEFTVIFLGESGVGKSTLISGLGNYLNWSTFEEAKKNQMQVCIPLQFKVQRRGTDKKIIETIVTAGDPEDNENFNDTGQSVTQQPKVHQFTFQSNKIKFIDTPGLSDSRGAEQDKENLRLIRECIHNQKEIHAICIVLKSNDARLRPEFELALRDLLSLFPKPALKNIFFFFTYASGTFFGIGDSTGPVKEMQKKIQDSHEETYSFEGENTCAIDSESFKFLLCEERGVKYSNRPEEDFDFCWNESAAQVKDFLTFIKTVKPIEKKTTLAVHYLATAALNLEEFIRNSDQLTPEEKEKFKREAKIFISAARKYSMVTEYHRLKTDVEHWDVDEFWGSCENCEKILKCFKSNFNLEIVTHFKEACDSLRSQNSTQNLLLKQEEDIDSSFESREETNDEIKKTDDSTLDEHNLETTILTAENVDAESDKPSVEIDDEKDETIIPVVKQNKELTSSVSTTESTPAIMKFESRELESHSSAVGPPTTSPPAIPEEWNNNVITYAEHQTIPLKTVCILPPAITKEWDNSKTIYTEHQTIPFTAVPSSPAPEPQEFTVIFLGENGVGKSTLINSLGNYLSWLTLEEAKKNQMKICIPLKFKAQRKKANGKVMETIVTVGDLEENENPNNIKQSATHNPKVSQFTFKGDIIRVIDTLELFNSKEFEQEKKNLELIRECVHNQKEIHAICIVLKSNDVDLRPEFEQTLWNFLSIFPKVALNNVFFFFTNASQTFFKIGNATEAVKEMQKKIEDFHEATYSFESRNTCTVDLKPFKFLLCKERGIKYGKCSEEEFKYYWKKSAAQVSNFLNFIKTVKPIEKKTTLAVHYLATAALRLEELISNSKLTIEKEKLVNESKIFISAARKYSMVTEYHRLKTDVEHWTVEEFFESCENCERILKSMDSDFDQQIFTRFKEASNALRPQSLVVKKEQHIHHSQHINKESSPQVKKTEITPNCQPHQDTNIPPIKNLNEVANHQTSRKINGTTNNVVVQPFVYTNDEVQPVRVSTLKLKALSNERKVQTVEKKRKRVSFNIA